MYERQYDWKGIVGQVDPEEAEKIGDLLEHILVRESEIPRKYKELILMACSAALRFGISIRTHGKEAMYHGASDREIVEVLSLVSMSAGFTAMIEGIEALGDQLTVEDEE